MRPATEPRMRKALAVFLQARLDRERAEAEYNAARDRWLAAGVQRTNAERDAVELLKAEHGIVTYDGYAFRVDRDRIHSDPISRELKDTQDPLPLESAA